MIRLENVWKSFGPRTVLAGVDLRVQPGTTACLIGGSGSGKSVTLKLIARLLEPDRGRILVEGDDATHAGGARLASIRAKLGLVFQSGALLQWLTVEENVALPLREARNATVMTDADVRARVLEILELLGVADAAKLYPSEISGGMQKRVAIARAVVRRPKVILYDEPTAGLDPVRTAVVDELIVRLQEELGVTQLVVTHDMPSVHRIADQVAFLHDGRVAFDGTSEELLATPDRLVREFVDAMSLASPRPART